MQPLEPSSLLGPEKLSSWFSCWPVRAHSSRSGLSRECCPAWNMNLPVQVRQSYNPDSLSLRIMWRRLVRPSFNHRGKKLEPKCYSHQERCFPVIYIETSCFHTHTHRDILVILSSTMPFTTMEAITFQKLMPGKGRL